MDKIDKLSKVLSRTVNRLMEAKWLETLPLKSHIRLELRHNHIYASNCDALREKVLCTSITNQCRNKWKFSRRVPSQAGRHLKCTVSTSSTWLDGVSSSGGRGYSSTLTILWWIRGSSRRSLLKALTGSVP